jgi:hypothetical protein
MSELDILQELSNVVALIMFYELYQKEIDAGKLVEFEDECLDGFLVDLNDLDRERKREIQDWQLEIRKIQAGFANGTRDYSKICVCLEPYHSERPMIQCDVCLHWMHLTCVNILPEETEAIEKYICPKCKGEKSIFELVKLYADSCDGLSKVNLSGASEEQVNEFVGVLSQQQLMDEIELAKSALESLSKEIREIDGVDCNEDVPMELNENEEKKGDVEIEKMDVSELSHQNDLANSAPVIGMNESKPEVFVKKHDDSVESFSVRIPWRDMPSEITQVFRAGKEIDLCISCCVCYIPDGQCICCDSCPRLFHPSCLGLETFDLPDPWFCENCSKSSPLKSPKKNAPKRKIQNNDDESDTEYGSNPRKKGRGKK